MHRFNFLMHFHILWVQLDEFSVVFFFKRNDVSVILREYFTFQLATQ